MSRLYYSSPGVINLAIDLESLILDCRGHSRLVRSGHASRAPIRSAVRFHTDFAVRRSQQRRVPQQSSDDAGCIKSFRLPKQAQVFRVIFQAQYQAFVHFAVGSSAALKAIALKWTCVLEPFTRGGLSL